MFRKTYALKLISLYNSYISYFFQKPDHGFKLNRINKKAVQ